MVLLIYNFLLFLPSMKSQYAEDAGGLMGKHELCVMYIGSTVHFSINRSFGLVNAHSERWVTAKYFTRSYLL